MTGTAIQAEALAKRYRLGTNVSLDEGLRELLDGRLRRWWPWAHEREPREARGESFWALEDVSFRIEQGSAVALVGRNGAGKSTLLKLLGRITPPTRGMAQVHGRIASLLEVGTGFQPDLTGRENVFLNGAILGMKRAEVRRQFDDIVGFAEVERFIDTPVKRYSSGMFTRLAFSVAAHLQAEILLVDEVLAVGDVAFQRRCLDKMGEVTTSGRTVIFVSHKLGAVRRLCERAIYLQAGRLVADGATHDVLASYVRDSLTSEHSVHAGHTAVFESWRFERSGRADANACVSGEEVSIAVRLKVNRPMENAAIQVHIWGDDDQVVMGACSRDDGGSPLRIEPGIHTVRMGMRLPLLEGSYALELCLMVRDSKVEERVELPPALVILPRGESALPRHHRGMVDERVLFSLDAGEGAS